DVCLWERPSPCGANLRKDLRHPEHSEGSALYQEKRIIRLVVYHLDKV
ncbi:hypothetical protein SAMN02746073_2920, partial [Legionella jamestowniensis DSM 19215]